jgi:peptide/nickel transport system permease protein
MLTFILRRLAHMVPTMMVISIIVFVMIQLPPGDFVDSLRAQLVEGSGATTADKDAFEQLRKQYHLDRPLYVQYLYWVKGFAWGDFGYSFEWRRPVTQLIWERVGLTMVLAFSSMFCVYLFAIPVGIYSARRPGTVGDHFFTSLAVLGLCVPSFILALCAMYIVVFWFGGDAGGLFSAQYKYAPWSMGKVWDMLRHLPLPVVVVGAAGTAGLVRIMRNSMMNVLKEQFITTARAKGLSEVKVIYKYGLRVAINPLISILGMQLPNLVSGSVIASIILSLPTTGPMFLKALQSQDMYLAGTLLLLMSAMLLIGNLLADVLLAMSDPRIRLE